MNVPDGLKYTTTDEWVRIEGDIATVGLTDFAQSELGDIVYFDPPEVGRFLQAEETFGVVESTKTTSDLISPLTGEVVAVNEQLASASELINDDPYGEGWLIRICIQTSEQSGELLSAGEYVSKIEAH